MQHLDTKHTSQAQQKYHLGYTSMMSLSFKYPHIHAFKISSAPSLVSLAVRRKLQHTPGEHTPRVIPQAANYEKESRLIACW